MSTLTPPQVAATLTFAERVEGAAAEAAHLLPAQGPIGVFVHHNTLHHFEGSKFEDAVLEAARTFDAEPYMSEAAYQREFARGRIEAADIDVILAREFNTQVVESRRLDRTTLRRVMLIPGLRDFRNENIEWLLYESDLLQRFRSDIPEYARHRLSEDGVAFGSGESTESDGDTIEAAALRALYAVCLARTCRPAVSDTVPARRFHEKFLASFGVGVDEFVDPMLIRLSSVYLDQGQAYWPMPAREEGFLRAVRKLLAQRAYIASKPLRGLTAEVRIQEEQNLSATETIERCLTILGVHGSDIEMVVEAEILALPGWAGLFHQMELRPEIAPHEPVRCSLMEFLAVRLTLVMVASTRLAEQHGMSDAAAVWQSPITTQPLAQERIRYVEAARLLDIAQLLGLSVASLSSLDDRDFARLQKEIALFDDWERRRVWHLAYERRHENLVLTPLSRYRAEWKPEKPQRPTAQVFCCLDEREESLRRHLEEIDTTVETFGAAGFYGVAVDYQGIDDAHGVPLCPAVVTPGHAVHEVADDEDGHLHSVRQARRKLWSQLTRGSFVSSRTLVLGWFSAAILGLFSLFPLVLRILSPRSYARLMRRLNRLFLPTPRTELTLSQNDQESHDAMEGLRLGFTPDEQADRVASVLSPAGLTSGFARLVVILGHGSISLNNPHESAHDCGACGGRRGAPNGRLFASMANRPLVRRLLVDRGITIPEDTWFIGGGHDTCSDAIDLFDLDELPDSHQEDLSRLQNSLREARARDAHERSRRFHAARVDASYEEALRHVEERSEHLAEPRPEYGHCTNAVCLVGRRTFTRGLFLDRRAFLTSYDPTQDTNGEKLTGLLAAVVPVCAGISLEYYFSFVDNDKYGCGTKLPHNVTGLVGVMNGHASDLRTGLPWQMVEIHEPVRILFVIEATQQNLLKAIQATAVVRRFVDNRWVRLAAMDPESGNFSVYRDGEFEDFIPEITELPEAASSRSWYQGHFDHLPIAHICSDAAKVS